MARNPRQGDRRLAVGIEGRPIQRDHDLRGPGQHVRDPVRKQRPHDEAGIAQEPDHRFDGVLGVQPARLDQAGADRMNRERDGVDDADHGIRHRLDPLGGETLAGHPVNQTAGRFRADHVSVHARLR